MPQHDVVRFLHDEGLPADVIHQHLVEFFGEKAMAYSTITRRLREMSWTGPKIHKGRTPSFSIDATILPVLNRDPTESIREIAREAIITEDVESCGTICLPSRTMIASTKVGHFRGATGREKAFTEVYSDGR
jgi:hypothetical protein